MKLIVYFKVQNENFTLVLMQQSVHGYEVLFHNGIFSLKREKRLNTLRKSFD